MENEMLSASMNMPSQNPAFIDDFSMLAEVQCEPPSHIEADFRFTNHASTADHSSLVPLQGRDFMGNASLRTSSATYNNEFQYEEQLAGATLITPASLAARFGLPENSERSATLSPSLESLLPYILSNQHHISNSSFATFEEPGHSELLGNRKGNDVNKFSKSPEPEGTTGFLASCSTRKLSKCLPSDKHVQFSHSMLGSRYLNVMQEILSQIARCSLESPELMNCSAAVIGTERNISSSDFVPNRRMVMMDHSASSMGSTLQRHSAESEKTQLLKLLQLVDNRYNQCLDEIHTVVSAFHAATELKPHVHAHFALQTVSLLYMT